jgi:hypothetical protein
MSVSKSILKSFVLFAALATMVISFGCGASAEKERMTAFIQDYEKALTEYTDAINKVETGKKAEAETKLNALKEQWMRLKEDIGSEVTPQTMGKFEAEFGRLEKKYGELSGKS